MSHEIVVAGKATMMRRPRMIRKMKRVEWVKG